MKRRLVPVWLGALAALGLLIWLFLRAEEATAPEGVASSGHPSAASGSTATDAPQPPADSPEPRIGGVRPGHEPADSPAEGLSRRAYLERAIRLAREARLAERAGPAAAGSPATTPAAEDAVGHLDPTYIRERIADIVPLVRECYELALAEDPALQGQLNVELVVSGEPEVGGIIEESRILDESTLASSTLHECVRETMYTIELDPPENGGRLTIRYPFTFRPE